MQRVSQYFSELGQRFGSAWNHFWFLRSDAYILSVIRILSGLMAIYLHLTYTPDLVRFFGAGGWLPVETMTEIERGGNAFSYLNYLSSPAELWTAHVLGFVALVLFTVGLLTRVTSILALIVVLAYVHRAPVLMSQVEPVLTMILFYLCLGPSGAYLSVDRLLLRQKVRSRGLATSADPLPSTWATLATRLLQVHVALLYAMMGLSKLTIESWNTGSGVWWLISRSDSRLVDFSFLQPHAYVINFWTHSIVLFELAFALLIWNRWARPLLLGLAVVMWTLTALITGQVLFALIMLIANLAYVPSDLLKASLQRWSWPRSSSHAEQVAGVSGNRVA